VVRGLSTWNTFRHGISIRASEGVRYQNVDFFGTAARKDNSPMSKIFEAIEGSACLFPNDGLFILHMARVT
jgi:hypothetical protein